MSVRIQVILDEEEAIRFKAQAMQESKSLSAWLRDAGRKMIEKNRRRRLTDPDSLRQFFQECNAGENGREPDWEDHKKLIMDSYRAGNRP